jgi:hypothetical protein
MQARFPNCDGLSQARFSRFVGGEMKRDLRVCPPDQHTPDRRRAFLLFVVDLG